MYGITVDLYAVLWIWRRLIYANSEVCIFMYQMRVQIMFGLLKTKRNQFYSFDWNMPHR